MREPSESGRVPPVGALIPSMERRKWGPGFPDGVGLYSRAGSRAAASRYAFPMASTIASGRSS